MDDVNIILVEDDEGDVKAIRRAFSKASICNPLIRFENGAEALSFLKGETSECPPARYVILSDINMPCMTGIELLEKLRLDPELRRTLFFVLTTSDDERDISAAYFHNVAGYILKSNADDMFIDLFSTMRNYWHFIELPIIDNRGYLNA